jgi:hypothetical protein
MTHFAPNKTKRDYVGADGNRAARLAVPAVAAVRETREPG